MGKKLEKNLTKVQSMLDGTYGGKIQSGYIPEDIHANRKVGEIWTDAEGDQWEQMNGYRSKISRAPAVGLGDTCSDCEKRIVKTWDKDVYKWNKRCYYCQIDFEAQFPRNIQGADHINKKIDEHTEYVMERGKNYIEGWMKENKIFEKERDEEKVFDDSVANALANSEVELSINKNKTMTK